MCFPCEHPVTSAATQRASSASPKVPAAEHAGAMKKISRVRCILPNVCSSTNQSDRAAIAHTAPPRHDRQDERNATREPGRGKGAVERIGPAHAMAQTPVRSDGPIGHRSLGPDPAGSLRGIRRASLAGNPQSLRIMRWRSGNGAAGATKYVAVGFADRIAVTNKDVRETGHLITRLAASQPIAVASGG